MARRVLNESVTVRSGGASVTVTADPFRLETDPAELGRGPAKTITEVIADGIRSVAATNRRGQRRWNATGHLANGIRTEPDGQAFAIVAPADRLQKPGMVDQLAEDVPEIDDPLTEEVDAALEHAVDMMLGG